MSKPAAGLIAAVLCVAVSAYASDPWKDKDPQSWDEKDVQKILQDSPWSHKVQFGMTIVSRPPGSVTRTGSAAHPETSADNGRPGIGTGVAGTSVNAPSVENGPRTDYTISWISARTIREAQARRRELVGVSPDVARKDLANPPDAYEVMVASSDMSALARQTEDQLKAHSYLVLKDEKTKIAPSHIRIQKDPIGAPSAIVFVFEKKGANGEPVIPHKEKGGQFVTELGKTPLKTSFDFSKMRDKQGLDL